MNAKKAKLLRKIARGFTVGDPALSYEPQYHPNGKEVLVYFNNPRLLGRCTRKLYKQLKRGRA